jgi:3-oxoacyl-[acyl-carrier-protein] synthase III
MKPFAIDRHGRLALPSHFFPTTDFSALDSVEQLTALVQRDFDSKGPSGAELLRRLETGAYRNRYELLVSEESGYATGADFSMNGGMYMA